MKVLLALRATLVRLMLLLSQARVHGAVMYCMLLMSSLAKFDMH